MTDVTDATDRAAPSGATRAKICGLTNDEDLHVAIEAGADAVGFVVSVPVDSPREISPKRARELVGKTPPFVTSVLVTMPDAPDEAASLVEKVDPDALQVHVANPTEVAAIEATVDVPVIAAIDAGGDFEAFSNVASVLLVDSLDAAGAGGTGETGDWERAREIVAGSGVPTILAGGLTPTNVARAVEKVEPFAVDVASGVEKRGGVKDRAAVRAFVERATSRSRTAVRQ